MHSSKALAALIASLCGRMPINVDWEAVIDLANHTLLTPTLFASLAEADELHQVPPDVRNYLCYIHDCNRQRNLRLRLQLHEAVSALNSCGIAPVLLKGAVPLFLSAEDKLPSRMTTDLDLGVEATEEPTAQACLEELGYIPITYGRGMARPQDVGLLELRPNRVSGLAAPITLQRDGLKVKIPTADARALHWIVHDLLKEGDYWRGRIDLRHLYDLAQLTKRENVDWAALRGSKPIQGARNAFDTQLLALNYFFGIKIPQECSQSRIARLQHWRRVFTAEYPVIGAPLRLAGTFIWGALRISRDNEPIKRKPAVIMRRLGRTILNRNIRPKI